MSPNMQDAHQDISELLPWFVNETLDGAQRARVEAHLQCCGECRAALRIEREVAAHVAAQVGVEYMPAASLKKLQARLDGATGEPAPAAASAPRPARRVPWAGALAASVAALAIAVGLLAAQHLTGPGDGGSTGSYHTVTTITARPPDEVIRAVFTPNLTLEQLQGVLDAAQLRIVSGPTEAGVYSLASTSTQPVGASLASLRQNRAVRFAETTRVVTEDGRTP